MAERASVVVTPLAAQRLADLGGNDPAQSTVRLFVAGQSCCGFRYGLAYEKTAADDDLVTDAGAVQVVVGPDVEAQCDGVTIDYVSTADGEGFMVQGRRTGGCGCAAR